MTRTSPYLVLGIDPGLNITGYGVLSFGAANPAIVEAGTIRPGSQDPLPVRLARLKSDLSELLEEVRPDLVAVEKLYSHYAHPQTSVLMGHARGVILLAAEEASVAVADVAATRVKKSLTGNGHASKQQVQKAVAMVFGLDSPPEPADVSDALAIALCAGRVAWKAQRV